MTGQKRCTKRSRGGRCYETAEERRERLEKVGRLRVQPAQLKAGQVHYEALQLQGRGNPRWEVFKITPKTARTFNEIWEKWQWHDCIERIVKSAKKNQHVTLCPTLQFHAGRYVECAEKFIAGEVRSIEAFYGLPVAREILHR